jgi:hypothetical protein
MLATVQPGLDHQLNCSERKRLGFDGKFHLSGGFPQCGIRLQENLSILVSDPPEVREVGNASLVDLFDKLLENMLNNGGCDNGANNQCFSEVLSKVSKAGGSLHVLGRNAIVRILWFLMIVHNFSSTGSQIAGVKSVFVTYRRQL